jgi:hypothetical protein
LLPDVSNAVATRRASRLAESAQVDPLPTSSAAIRGQRARASNGRDRRAVTEQDGEGRWGGAVAPAFACEWANVFLAGRALAKLDKVAEAIVDAPEEWPTAQLTRTTGRPSKVTSPSPSTPSGSTPRRMPRLVEMVARGLMTR